MEILKNEIGITIKQLKELVKDLPEKDEHGEDYELFMETGVNENSLIKEIWPLNKTHYGQDLEFVSTAFDKK